MSTDVNLLDDRAVVNAILMRDLRVTQQFLYVKCYPLFKAVYDNYYTDCLSCVEFINEIYLLLLAPKEDTGLCKLQTFQFSSTLATWLKTVAVFYCYERYRRKKTITFLEEKVQYDGEEGDRIELAAASIYEEDTSSLCAEDVETLLALMPNRRYSEIIRLRYLEGLSNEEAAQALQMSIDNFYNKQLRAKKQFTEVLKKEEGYGKSL